MDGGLASRYESGYTSFDMKPGLLNGPNAKTDKAGHRYNVVPFTHSTPGSQRQKGLPMPQPMDGDMKDFGRRSKNPWVVNLEARARRVPEPMAAGYTWKSSPYEGMIRVKKPGHTSYMTFRRVTEEWTDKKGRRRGSASDSWIHPGMAANPIMGSVVAFVEPHVQKAIDQLVADIIGGA
jgi:hypothetical protein